MFRAFNFSAGPSVLPVPVLEKAAAEMLDYQGSGMSVMEMSHRSKVYESIIQGAEALMREVMNIPENYYVLFLQGGASLQFSMVPLNLLGVDGEAAYINTGSWSSKAIKEAEKVGKVTVLASSKDSNFTRIPDFPVVKQDFDYLHITTNNTIYGTRYIDLPKTGRVPLVADMSSNILSEPCDVSKYGLIYAGAQKNLGPAGVTVVIIRRDLIGRERENIPTMLSYKIHAENNSLYNTPPCYAVYIVKLVLEWLKENGGVHAMYEVNKEKAALIYDFLDQSNLFKGTVDQRFRSLMNIPFRSASEELDSKFIKESEKAGFSNLKGHRSVGGMRASIYNAMPMETVKKLADFMKKFEKENT